MSPGDPLPLHEAGAQTLLPLLERLANRALARRWRLSRVAPLRVRLERATVWVELEVNGLGRMLNGVYRLRADLLASDTVRTQCRWCWEPGGGLSRWVGRGVALVPRAWLNGLLQRYAGEGLRLEGDRLWIEHATLVRRLFREAPVRKPPGA